jgi:hypothetical protein
LEKINAIEIYNMLSEKVYTINNFKQPTSNKIDLSNSPSEIYSIIIHYRKKIYLEKIVMQ